jgi:Tetratricopeptide repeat
MKRIFRIVITGFFFALPMFLLSLVGGFGNLMRWNTGSPLVPGYSWMRWSHLYLILGSLFCFSLYVPIVISAIKRNLKILLIPLLAAIALIIFSFVFIGISRNVYYRQIIEKCDQEIKNNLNDSIPLEKKATAYNELGDHGKAIKFFTEAIKITPKPAYVIHDRAMAYGKNKEYDKAIQDFNKAMELNPDEKDFIAQCYSDRGFIYFQSGQFEKSWQDVSKALVMGYRVHPGFLAALEERGYKRR